MTIKPIVIRFRSFLLEGKKDWDNPKSAKHEFSFEDLPKFVNK